MYTPHLPVCFLAFALFVSPTLGQALKPGEVPKPKTELTASEISKKGDCLLWFVAEYAGNPYGISAETMLRWHREKLREQRPKAHELARKLGLLTQHRSIDWLFSAFGGEDTKPIRYAHRKCFIENEAPGLLGFD